MAMSIVSGGIRLFRRARNETAKMEFREEKRPLDAGFVSDVTEADGADRSAL